MKKLLQIFVSISLLGSLQYAAAQTSEKCFKGEWLQQSHRIVFKTNGAKVTGTFTVSPDAGDDVSYDFTGVRAGNTLTVKFAGGKMPDIAPSEMKGLAWTIAPKGSEEVLKIRVYGKNYETNKYATSFAEYEPCRPGYAGALHKAKPVTFIKGAAAMKIAFAGNEEWQVFSLNVRSGQSLVVEAYGCRISIYMPGKTPWEEWENADDPNLGKTSTLLDVISILSAPQTGNYLVMLQNAGGNPQAQREIVFKISN